MAPQVLAIFGDKNIDINNKKAKRKATTWGFPIFLTDKPSFFRGFDEPMENRYNSKPILLLVNNYFFYLKGIQNVRKDFWCCLINEKGMQKFNCLLSSSAVVKHSSPYPTRVFLHFPACHVVAWGTRFFLFPGGFQHASFKRLVLTPKNVRTRFKILVRLSS